MHCVSINKSCSYTKHFVNSSIICMYVCMYVCMHAIQWCLKITGPIYGARSCELLFAILKLPTFEMVATKYLQ